MRISWLQDHKTKHIQYSHATCLWIVQIHCMYGHVMSVFALFLFFSQVDFAIVRLLADWIVTGFSTVWFIQGKVYDPSLKNHSATAAMQQQECSKERDGKKAAVDDLELELASLDDDDDEQNPHTHAPAKKSLIEKFVKPTYERCENKDPESSFSSAP